jgi:hypothetical protein
LYHVLRGWGRRSTGRGFAFVGCKWGHFVQYCLSK